MVKPPSTTRTPLNPLLHVFMGTLVASVGGEATDLTTRQLAVFLKVYLEPDTEQTVRGLATALNISKPAITRALDRLGELDLVKRKTDPHDRRSVIATRTLPGSTYLRTLNGYLTEASRQAGV